MPRGPNAVPVLPSHKKIRYPNFCLTVGKVSQFCFGEKVQANTRSYGVRAQKSVVMAGKGKQLSSGAKCGLTL
jgi:hypothetical protein